MLTLNDGRAELWQWDTGRTLAVDADCSQVHFSNKVFGRSIDVDVADGMAIIPDVLLQTDKDLNVWAFVGAAENGYTKISKTFKVNRRNKPSDYVFTPPEQTTLAELSERLDKIEESQDPDAIKNAVDDYLKQNPVEVPVQSVNGQIGAVELTAENVGAISRDDLQAATNEALAQAKASGEFDGADGQPGENGTDGYSPTANVTQNDNGATITITDKNGTTMATITNGKDGADGRPGKDGANGADGQDGITPTIGENGNWYLGDTDTGKPSRGATGATGEKGTDGKTAYQYAQEGGYTGTEAEFASKLAEEMPEALPNPNALTFTGAVEGSYDGSSPVSVEIPSGGGSTVNNNTVNQYFYNSLAPGKYDLKDGYGTTADIYIAADGTETAYPGLHYVATDYIPVSANTTYVAYCNGYALYSREKTFVSAVIDDSNYGAMKEFTPEQDGYVRITYRTHGGSTTNNFNRLCEKSEIKKAPRDYMPAISPFFDSRIPCNVDLYGDSNSYGYGLSDTSNAWSNRLGALLLSMPGEIKNAARCEMSVFADIYSGKPKLKNNGVVYMSAYTDKFTVNGSYITAVDVYIDGVQQEQMTASPAEYTCALGYHEIELRGSSGNNNVILSIVTNKTRSFTNHATTGSSSNNLPNTVAGNVEIVMYGTNDRGIVYGETADNMSRFYRACEAAGAKVYFLSPIPTRADGETDPSYVQTIGDVISQIPDINYIDVYKDMQLYSLLSTETLYSDKLHLNDFGHKVLFCIVASKLHLAALNSIFNE